MAKTAKIKVKSEPSVIMEAEVARKIRQHARTSLKAEVCGVLIGSNDDQRTMVEACIAGNNAAQGGAHVTFTQDTWEHIYKIKDQEFPDDKIVGWYHSHPGFGVFLSEHDLFIQENFFSNPGQIAWVYDPHTDEEGCFGWIDGKIEKLSGLRFGYSQQVELQPGENEADYEDEDQEQRQEAALGAPVRRKRISEEPAWAVWTGRILGYLSVLLLGLVIGYLIMSWRVAPILSSYQMVLDHPVEACQQLLKPYFQLPPGAAGPDTSEPMTPSPSEPSTHKPPAGKGSNGQH